MPVDPLNESDGRVLSLFENPSEIDTPTPGVKVWVAGDRPSEGTALPVIIKRLRETSGIGSRKARATEALHLSHPNILPPRRWLADGGYIYVVRDVVRGKNFRQALTTVSGERPGPELLRKLLFPLADAVTYAHRQGVVHGGLSPENILIAEDGRLLLLDFATTDVNAPRHQPDYGGTLSVLGDVRALGSLLAAYLPNSGAFQNLAVRGRIEGLIRRCDSIEDLREILQSLEKLAAAPLPTAPGGMSRPKDGVPSPAPLSEMPTLGLPRLELPSPASTMALPEVTREDIADEAAQSTLITVAVLEPTTYLPQGGGGVAAVTVRNESPRPMVLRTIVTQHAWLNPRPIGLPLILPISGTERLEFAVSAARLTPGEYRSEIYLTVHPVGEYNEMTNTGAEKHISEIRITVNSNLLPVNVSSQASVPGTALQGRPTFPANAPRVQGPGCAALSLLLLLPVPLLAALHLLGLV